MMAIMLSCIYCTSYFLITVSLIAKMPKKQTNITTLMKAIWESCVTV